MFTPYSEPCVYGHETEVMTRFSEALRYSYLRFTSRKTTICLIVILVCLYSLGLIIPQRSIMPPEQFDAWQKSWPGLVKWLNALRFTSIYSSPLVVFFTALFFLNLLLVFFKRIPTVINEIRLPAAVSFEAEVVKALPFNETISINAQGVEDFKERLRSKGFMVVGESCFKGIKNRFSSIGSLLFHMSFIFFLVGGLFIFHTRFWGETFVTEGQSFSGERPEYRSVGRLSELRKELPDIGFVVEKIEPQFEMMEPTSLKTRLRLKKGGITKTEVVDVNYPAKIRTTSILITDVGVAPYFIISDHRRHILFDAYVMLNIIRGDEDFIFLPDGNYRIKIRFWPDYGVDDTGRLFTKSYYLNNPLFLIEVFSGERSIAKGYIQSPLDAVEFDGRHLRIGEIRYFGRFLITDEYGGWIVIAGFILSTGGLMLKLLWIRREVYGMIENDEEGRPLLIIGYRSEYFRALNRTEFEALLRDIDIRGNQAI